MQVQANIVESYFLMLNNLSLANKKALAEKLLASTQEPKSTSARKSIHDFAGAWDDDQTAEEIIEDIYKGRISTRTIEPL